MSESYSVQAVLSADDKGFSSAMKNAGSAVTTLGQQLKSGIGFGAMMAIGNKAVSVVGNGIKGLATGAVNAGMNFQSAMSSVSSISGATGKNLDDLTAKAKQMGETTQYTATEAANAMEYMAMAGWKTKDMISGIDGIMNLAAASGTDLAKTSDIVTDALTAFGKKAKDSGKFADVMAAASSNANTNVEMMGETFKYVGAAAGAMKYSINDIALATGLMANSGIKGSEAGTALRSVITRMAKPTKESQTAMDALGLSITDSNGKMKSFKTIMQDMRKGMKGMTEDQKASYAAMLGGQEAMSGVLAVANASESDFNKLSVAIDKSTGSAEKMAKVKLDNLKGDVTILQSGMEGLGITIFNQVGGSLRSLVGVATSVVGNINKKLSKGKGIENAFKKISPYCKVVVKDAKEVGQAFGTAISSIGKSLGKLNRSFGSAKSVSGFKAVLGGATGALKSFAKFCEEHSGTIASLINQLPKLLVAYKGFKIVKTVAPAVKTFSSAITKLAGKAIATIAGKLFGIATGEKAVGSASVESARSTMQAAKAFMMLGVGVFAVAAGFGIMAGASIALANSGGVAIGVMAGMIGALALVGLGMTAMLKSISAAPQQLTSTAIAMLAMGAAVVLVAAGLAIMAAASIALANAGTPAIACMAGMVVAVGALMAIAGAVGPAMTAGAVGFIAFGAAIVLVATGALIAAAALYVVAGVLPTVVQYGTSGAVAIAALGASMIVFGAGAAVAGAGCIVLGAGLLALGVGATVAGGGLLVLGTVLTVTGSGFTTFANVIKTVIDALSGGFKTVLDGISGVIKSVGQSAKDAGTGFKSTAEGIKMISGLSIGSIAKSLGAVAIGIGKISRKGSEIQQTANGMKTLSEASTSVNASFSSMGSKATSALAGIKKAMSSTANAAKSSGKKMGSGFTSSMQSGLSRGPGIASKAVSSVNSRLRSGRSGAYSAGAYISQGFASGMSSCLGQIESAASRMVSAAEKAIRAKAQIHSPSRMTKKDGRYIAVGLAIGIRSGINSVKSASKTLAKTAINTMKKATKSRKYEDAASSAIDKYKTSMNSKVSSITKSLNKKINAGVKKLKKQHPKLKKAYTKVGSILKSDMSKTIKKQGQKAINAADKALTALGKKYQEKYDAIAADRDNYKSKLSDYGDLFSSDSYGYISLVDFKAQKKQADQLAKNMEKLKKVLPYDLMRDIQDLDTAQGLKYTNELLKKSDSWLKQYGKDYSAFMSSANKNAKKYYQPYIDQIDKDYNSAVTKELSKLKKKMNTIAKEATQGFVKGLTSKSNKKALNKAAKDLANILTKAVKGKLKIHSPSRVMKSLGVYVVKGFVNGITSMANTLDKTMDSIITIPDFNNLAIAGDVGGSLNNDYEYYTRAEYTVIVPVELDGKEVARVTAPYTEAELNKRQTRQQRKLGRK